MIRWESGPDTVADQVDPSWQQPSLMAESPQRDKAPCNTTKTGRSPQGVELASNFPRTQDKKISARRAGRSPIQGGSTSQATGLKGSGTRDHRTPPVSCFHALMDQSLIHATTLNHQTLSRTSSCCSVVLGSGELGGHFDALSVFHVPSWHSWAVVAVLLSCCSQQVMVVAFICQPGSTLLSWHIGPAQQGFASRTHPGYLPEGESLTLLSWVVANEAAVSTRPPRRSINERSTDSDANMFQFL